MRNIYSVIKLKIENVTCSRRKVICERVNFQYSRCGFLKNKLPHKHDVFQFLRGLYRVARIKMQYAGFTRFWPEQGRVTKKCYSVARDTVTLFISCPY